MIEYYKFFYDNLKITNKCGFIMLVDNEVIGNISWNSRNLPDYVQIENNCILTKYKGKGYAHILLEETINKIKKYDNISKIIVTKMSGIIMRV